MLRYKLITFLISFLFAVQLMAVNRTWTGAVNNDFNTVGNWTGGGALAAADNFTITLAASTTITLSANITVNNLTMDVNSGAGIVLGKLDVLNRRLTINGTFSCNPVQYFNASNRDEVQIDAGSGTIIFNGTATFQTTGGGDTKIEADAASQGTMWFMSTFTMGAWAYTVPGIEPDFIYDATFAQSVVYNSNNFVVPASMVFGSTNSPTVTYSGTGTDWAFSTYDGAFVTNNTSIADINNFDCDAFFGATMTLNNGTDLQIGGDSDFPSAYTTTTIGATSRVTYDGASAQTVTALTYGHLNFGGSNAKTSAGSFSIRGDWTNNGTFAHGNDVHTFNGTPNQTIGGTNLTTFYRITENKTSGKILLARDTRAANRLTLTNGVFDLNGNDMRINATATAAITRTNGYVLSERTDMTSTLTRTINSSTGNKVFPFGTVGGTYIPFTYARNASSQGLVTVATYPTAADDNLPYPAPVTHVNDIASVDNSASAVDRFWDIDVTGTMNADLTFTYANAEVPAGGEVNLRAQQWTNTASPTGWLASTVNIASQSSNAGANTVTANGVTNSIENWTLALDATPLPIDLVSFEGECKNSMTELTWITAAEINNDFFTIERSVDALDFQIIDYVNGAGNSNSIKEYTYTDNSPYSQTYYRLKQTDFNGDFEYSELITVESCNETNFDFVSYQKDNKVMINITADTEGVYTLNLLDLRGKIVLSEQREVQAGNNSIALSPSIVSGIYLVRLSSSDSQKSYSQKLPYTLR